MPITVEVTDFEGIEDQWGELLPSCATNTIFVTPWWQRVWWDHFGDGSELQLLTVRDGDRLLGIAPMRIREGVLSFLGDTDLFDYHDFLVARGSEEAFYEALCDHLQYLNWRSMFLGSLPEGSPTLTHLPLMAERMGMSVEVSEEDTAPVAYLPTSWDGYLAGLSKRDRHELRRKLRRLDNADHAHQYICDNPETLAGCMGDFFRLLRSSSPEKAAFLTAERESFFSDVASELASRGQFKLYFLEVDEKRVASCICFDYGDSYLLYNSGYDPDYASLSVGLLNKALCIREAIEQGRQRFEFLRGAERYKYDLGGKDRVLYQLVAHRGGGL
ncbi:MAG: GNAT family N-acetyltransferase [Chloroflexi bacterium]|nr:GNAT family N-acetyltransferase [Chloroflexota bacterium]